MLRPEKLIVKAFYDTYGWVRDGSGTYHDSADFSDHRPVLAAYERKTDARIAHHVGASGRLWLDAGSGAAAGGANVQWSRGFERRVCLDISRLALKEARTTLGAGGSYVQGDLASLPFPDDTFDAIVCAHALYHVPLDEQEAAVKEMYRTLAPGGACVIVYASPRSTLCETALRLAPFTPRRLLRKLRGAPGTRTARRRPPLYFHAYDHGWFARTLPADWHVEVHTWRSADYRFTRSIVANGALGRCTMAAVYWFEALMPRAALAVGAYPMIVIRKPLRL